jgi:hypothetical protein
MAAVKTPDTCWICGSAISLEMCTFDAEGFPVHGPCLSAMLSLKKSKPSKACKKPLLFVPDGHAQKVLS